jgi:MFS transporter, Spinster family, sphingosine-1-phosphate transporter
MLTVVNLICYLDRYIIASVSPKIQIEFGLSHAQTGFFMSAFMVGYMVTSPIFGYLGDRKSRPVLMGVGVVAWSLATFASGLAGAFWTLIAARCFVGVGEASFATLAPPFIRDSLEDESTINKVLGVFYTSIPVGAAIGYIWGGWMADHMNWRYAFYLGAVPGALLTLPVWRMAEPGHRTRQISDIPFKETLKGLLANRNYCFAVGAYIAQTYALGGFSAWGPQYGVDVLGATLTESAFKMGASTLLSGIIGTLIGAKWGDIFIQKGADKSGDLAVLAFSKFCGWTSVIATPISLWMFHVTTLNEFIIAIFLVQTAIFAALAPANTAILAAVPGKIAATAFAVSIFLIHALGDVISPPLTGYLADFMPMDKAMLNLVVALAASAVIWLVGGRQPQAARA